MKFKAAVFWALLIAFLISTPGCMKSGPPKELADKIDKAMTLISRSDHQRLVQLLVEPEVLAELIKDKSMDQFVIEFASRDKDLQLLESLRSIRNQKPAINADKSKATFQIDENAVEACGGRTKVVFYRAQGEWYMEN